VSRIDFVHVDRGKVQTAGRNITRNWRAKREREASLIEEIHLDQDLTSGHTAPNNDPVFNGLGKRGRKILPPITEIKVPGASGARRQFPPLDEEHNSIQY
jgi:hypothetical protein